MSDATLKPFAATGIQTQRASVRQLDSSTVPAFRELLCTPPHGWCWCVAWETPSWDGWAERPEEQNRELRERLWSRGEYHGFVLYLDDVPAGWLRVGPRAAFPKVCSTYHLEPRSDVYSFLCFGMRGGYECRGLVHTLMNNALRYLARDSAISAFEGFPLASAERTEPGKAWLGPSAVFAAQGFEPVGSLAEGSRIHMWLESERWVDQPATGSV